MALNVLLAKPLVKQPINSNGDVGLPLGLLYLAAYVREHNPMTAISVNDYRLDKQKGLVRNLESDLADADVVCVGSCTTEIYDSLAIFKAAKELGKITVAGGIFPSSNPSLTVK